MLENKFKIGNETIREIVPGEQYTVRPGTEEYYIDDCGDEYEITIIHNGEEWSVQARTFRDGEAESEDIISSSQYFDMIPQIIDKFDGRRRY